MPLRLRRGTDAERLLITPVEGELIYITDTKRLYVGDGVTTGGNDVVNIIGSSLNGDLNLNSNNINGLGNINITGNINAQIIQSPNIQAGVLILTGNIISTSSISSDITIDRDTTFTKDVVVDGVLHPTQMIGSVYSNSSTLLVDADTGIISNGTLSLQDSSIVSNDTFVFGGLNNYVGVLELSTNDNHLHIRRVWNESNAPMSSNYGQANGGLVTLLTNNFAYRGSDVDNPQVVQFNDCLSSEQNYGWDGTGYARSTTIWHGVDPFAEHPVTTGYVPGAIAFITDGAYGRRNVVGINSKGWLSVNRYPNDARDMLDVNGGGYFDGVVKATGFEGSVYTDNSTMVVNGTTGQVTASSVTSIGIIQFGLITTTERDSNTPSNGTIIYNTTDNKFQGYQNGGWINLDDGSAA